MSGKDLLRDWLENTVEVQDVDSVMLCLENEGIYSLDHLYPVDVIRDNIDDFNLKRFEKIRFLKSLEDRQDGDRVSGHSGSRSRDRNGLAEVFMPRNLKEKHANGIEKHNSANEVYIYSGHSQIDVTPERKVHTSEGDGIAEHHRTAPEREQSRQSERQDIASLFANRNQRRPQAQQQTQSQEKDQDSNDSQGDNNDNKGTHKDGTRPASSRTIHSSGSQTASLWGIPPRSAEKNAFDQFLSNKHK